MLVAIRASLTYSAAGSGSDQVTSALNDLNWVLMAIGWFPIAMLVMAGSFGLWRAGIFSTRAFEAGVTAMVLVLLGTTTWASDGFWAPDGVYARFVPTLTMLAWISAVSVFLVRRYSAATTPERAAVAAP
jgi:hypothetical protein